MPSQRNLRRHFHDASQRRGNLRGVTFEPADDALGGLAGE
jgi:hypothetical protein